MSFLNTGYSATVAARLTQKGRSSIAKGNFVVSYFSVGDSEYNYNGTSNQSILSPFDKNTHIKYPIWYTSGTTFFGIPVEGESTVTCRNVMSPDSGWTVSTVWDKNPIGLSNAYTSNKYTGVKSFLGYTSSSGQTYNTGTTIQDTTDTEIIISPEEQKAIAIVHYTQSGTTDDAYKFFKYDDSISTSESVTIPNSISDRGSFEIALSSIYYHRSVTTDAGATFKMGTVDRSIFSPLNSRFELKYRDLLDSLSHKVGKIFYNQKIIVFHDEEIVTALDTGSTRNYTLPAPKVDVLVTNNDYLTDLTTGKTLWVTYKFSGGTVSDDIPCSYFMKVTGSSNNEVVTVKFNNNDQFKNLNNGYNATEFHILYQLTDNGVRPSSNLWKIRNYTSELTAINDLKTGHTFTINQTKYADTTTYSSSLSGFGVDRPLSGGTVTGTVSLVRTSDIEEMNFKVNLPDGKFTSSQNPTKTGNTRVTEVALLNNDKEVLVMGKLANPLERTGSQIISVKIDF